MSNGGQAIRYNPSMVLKLKSKTKKFSGKMIEIFGHTTKRHYTSDTHFTPKEFPFIPGVCLTWFNVRRSK